MMEAVNAARTVKSAGRSRLQRAGNLSGNATGAANEPREEEKEDNVEGNHNHPVRDPVGGSHSWGNRNAPNSTPHTLGIPGGVSGRITKQATTFPAEGNAPRAGEKAQELHKVMMGGNRMLHNTVGGGNEMRGATAITASATVGQKQGASYYSPE